MLNISDNSYLKLSFEAMEQKKSIKDIIKERIFLKDFSADVNEAFDNWMQNKLEDMLKD